MDQTEAHNRTMREIMDHYNKVVFHCFDKCVSNFNHAQTSEEERACIDACQDKSVNYNQRHMMHFMELWQKKQQQMMKVMEETQAAAAAAAAQTPPTVDSPPQSNAPTLGGPVQVLSEGGDTNIPQNVSYELGKALECDFFLRKSSPEKYTGQTLVERWLKLQPDSLHCV